MVKGNTTSEPSDIVTATYFSFQPWYNRTICTFCTESKESLLHLFWEYTYSKHFWHSFVIVLENYGLKMQYINAFNIILYLQNLTLYMSNTAA